MFDDCISNSLESNHMICYRIFFKGPKVFMLDNFIIPNQWQISNICHSQLLAGQVRISLQIDRGRILFPLSIRIVIIRRGQIY